MKTRILWTIVAALAVITVASSSGTAIADGGKVKDKGPRPKPPEIVERVLRSEPVFDEAGELVGTAEIVALEPAESVNSSSVLTSSAVTSATSYKTCTVEFYLKNIYGQKVISYKLQQTFTYDGSRVVFWYTPVVTSSTMWGWSGSDFTYGSYWISSPWSKRSWASGTFTLKAAWFTVSQYRPTIGVDGYGSGYCKTWGYW